MNSLAVYYLIHEVSNYHDGEYFSHNCSALQSLHKLNHITLNTSDTRA